MRGLKVTRGTARTGNREQGRHRRRKGDRIFESDCTLKAIIILCVYCVCAYVRLKLNMSASPCKFQNYAECHKLKNKSKKVFSL